MYCFSVFVCEVDTWCRYSANDLKYCTKKTPTDFYSTARKKSNFMREKNNWNRSSIFLFVCHVYKHYPGFCVKVVGVKGLGLGDDSFISLLSDLCKLSMCELCSEEKYGRME